MDAVRIGPQPGPQNAFLSSSADIVIFGGAAGGGKTFGLLLEPLRHVSNPDFGAVIFREEFKQISAEGGLWDEAMKLYPLLGAVPKGGNEFRFPSGASVSFGHLRTDDDCYAWQGSQIATLLFDELVHFSRFRFFYMLSRNRSVCGVRPYVRATTNPDADSWVAEFIAWWIDPDTGFPIPERSGVVRWFVRISDAIHWADSPVELAEAHGCPVADAKSVTFIAAKITDNPALLARDPGYMANLKALSRVERARLLDGNWKVRAAPGMYFNRGDVAMVPARPNDVTVWVRAWDLAATEPGEGNDDPDWTAGVLMGKRRNGNVVIADLTHFRKKAATVRANVKNTATTDGKDVRISLPEDPGQAGKDQAQGYSSMLHGHIVRHRRRATDKQVAAEPFASQWQAGNVEVVGGPWNDALFAELEAFPSPGAHDDIVDACADGYAELALHARPPAVSWPQRPYLGG